MQRAATEDIVSRQGDQERVLDIVVERVAVANAFERDASGVRDHLHQRRLRAEPATHIGAEKLIERICRQFR